MTANFKFGMLITVAVTLLGKNHSPLDFSILVPLQEEPAKPRLSDYAFFAGPIADLIPASGVFPYEVNAPLFSDYAQKARFIFLPEGQKMQYDSERPFDFPSGAILIKNFFYWKDARAPEKGRQILETRLLLKGEKDWKALEYLWNAEQTDAFLEVAGASFPVNWVNEKGKKQSLEYIAPNLNQCKGCHSYDGQFVPIGLTARQLNRVVRGENQLTAWQKSARLHLPENFEIDKAPCLADYMLSDHELEQQFSVERNILPTQFPELRARAYLDANCGHCHNSHGPASTSGMYLNIHEMDPEHLGVGKPPVAAGRGSGDRRFGIVPGKPGESILVFRMESDDPGIRMPELGRQLRHEEGLEIVKAWIRGMK